MYDILFFMLCVLFVKKGGVTEMNIEQTGKDILYLIFCALHDVAPDTGRVAGIEDLRQPAKTWYWMRKERIFLHTWTKRISGICR